MSHLSTFILSFLLPPRTQHYSGFWHINLHINTLTTVYLEGDIYCCSLLDWPHYHWLSIFINHQIQVTSGQKTFELCKKLTSGIRPSNIQIKYSDVLLEALKQSFNKNQCHRNQPIRKVDKTKE